MDIGLARTDWVSHDCQNQASRRIILVLQPHDAGCQNSFRSAVAGCNVTFKCVRISGAHTHCYCVTPSSS